VKRFPCFCVALFLLLFAAGATSNAETVRLPGGVPLEMVSIPAGIFWMGQ
jgi:hypothetical protein